MTDGDGAGRVRSSPAGLDCQADCSARFARGSQVALSAEPSAGSDFAGWTGDCSGSQTCSVTLDQARSVTARYTLRSGGDRAGLWVKGDLHVHNDHSSDGSLLRQTADDRGPGNVSITDQIGWARLMGLQFLPLTDHRTYDQHYDPTWTSADLLLIPGEEANGSPHATVHGAVDTVVQGADTEDELRRLQQSIWDAHLQGAIWITAHPDDGEIGDDGLPNRRGDALGIDLVETWNRASDVEKEIDYVENRWNAGYRFGIAGASDNHFRELWVLAGPGMPTTEVFTRALTERALLQAASAGNTTIHAGPGAPVVRLEADFDGDGVYEAMGGDEVFVPAGTRGMLRVSASGAMGNRVLIYQAPGRSIEPLASFAPSLLELDAQYTQEISAPAGAGWYRAEIRGLGLPAGLNTGDIPLSLLPNPVELPDQLRALSSPVFVSPAAAVAQPSAPIPADSGEDDGAQPVLGVHGAFAGFPHLATAAGISHLVAEQHIAGDSVIAYRQRLANGRWAAPTVLSNAPNARFPRIAVLGQRVVAVWQSDGAEQRPRRPAIVLRESLDGGLNWQPERILRAVEGRAEHPDLNLSAEHGLVVVWQEIREGAPFDVWLQRVDDGDDAENLSNAGKTIAAANLLDSRSARYPASVWPRITGSADGRLAVSWQDNRNDVDPLWTGVVFSGEGTDPDDWQIAVRTLPPDGATWSELQLIGDASAADRHPAVAYAPDGALVLAWDSKPLQSSGANLAVLSARATDGATFGAIEAIAPAALGHAQYPQFGLDADGRVRAVWYDSRSEDWRWRVMTAVLGDSGWTAARLIPSRGNNSWPTTAGGRIAFASTRNAARLQRDRTQEIVVLDQD
ncbi:MAG TPA: CehA/McbA family metallohydrolase [Fontimonas sp.]